jgi:hypothetical protein
MVMPQNPEQILVVMTSLQRAWVEKRAKADGRSMCWIIRKLIDRAAMEEQELMPHTDRAAR